MGKAEAHVEKYLVDRVKTIGGEIRKSTWIGRRGCPDRRAMLPTLWREHLRWVVSRSQGPTGQNPWVECKAEGEDLEDHQVREIAKMRMLGELVLVIDTRELVDLYFPLVIP